MRCARRASVSAWLDSSARERVEDGVCDRATSDLDSPPDRRPGQLRVLGFLPCDLGHHTAYPRISCIPMDLDRKPCGDRFTDTPLMHGPQREIDETRCKWRCLSELHGAGSDRAAG